MWDPNSEPDLAGYRVFCRGEGQLYDYNNPIWEGTSTNCTISDLDETKTYYFVSRAFDNYGLESIDSNELVLEADTTPDNQAPIADAGPDQIVNEGQAVLLNGSNSTDPDDGIASYHWFQIGGPAVNLSDPDVKQQTFTAPDVGPEGAALSFELTVADYNGLQSNDSCVVNVTWQNEPPQANAGLDQTVNEGSVVTLDGSYSLDIDDGIESYSWNQISGPAVILSNPASCQPTFTAPNVESDGVSLTFNLTVTDADGLKNTDSCIVNISWQNEPPIAVVTPDYMEATEGTLIALDGSASTDSDDGIDSYLWSQVEGDPVSLSDSTSAVTTFTAPKTEPLGKNIKLKLTVKDHGGLQGTADSSIYVMQNELPNNSPAVDFSYATRKKLVTFTDRSTDSDGTIVSWFWDFGDGKTSTEQNPGHRYRKIGNYSVTLTVTDDGGVNNFTSKNLTVTK
ncbi:MAG: PKD domain-containing protein [Thermodesulfobacteriota bacterium]|nr:PKD domain-containing protein [Thermodesulfobacteriota bacterium]